MNKITDLSSLDTVAGSEAGFEVVLTHPGTGEDLDIVITVIGKDSERFQKFSRDLSRKRVKNATKRRGGSILSPEELEKEGLDILTLCTRGWKTGKDHHVVVKNEQLQCTAANVKRVYTEFPWIREQIDTAIGDRANFLPKELTDSASMST